MLVGWGIGEEAGGSTCVTEKVVEYFLVFDNMVGEVWCSGGQTYPGAKVFWSTCSPSPHPHSPLSGWNRYDIYKQPRFKQHVPC